MGGRQHTSIAQPSCQQPQSWRPSCQFSPSAPTRSSLTSSSTTNPRPQRAEELARVDEDGTKMSDWASEHQRPPLRVLTSVSPTPLSKMFQDRRRDFERQETLATSTWHAA